jgi:hypothetical protein
LWFWCSMANLGIIFIWFKVLCNSIHEISRSYMCRLIEGPKYAWHSNRRLGGPFLSEIVHRLAKHNNVYFSGRTMIHPLLSRLWSLVVNRDGSFTKYSMAENDSTLFPKTNRSPIEYITNVRNKSKLTKICSTLED